MYIYPEAQQLVGGEPLGDGLARLVTGTLTLLLVLGLHVLEWAERNRSLSHLHGNIALLALCAGVILGNSLVLYYLPDALEAVGMLVVTVPAVLLVIRDTVVQVRSTA